MKPSTEKKPLEPLTDNTIIYGWYGDDPNPTEYKLGERMIFFKGDGDEMLKAHLEKYGKCNMRFAVYTREKVSPFEN